MNKSLIIHPSIYIVCLSVYNVRIITKCRETNILYTKIQANIFNILYIFNKLNQIQFKM